MTPELYLLIGSKPEVNPLPPIEVHSRFNDLFCRFMACLATQEHPLVLFIDDLQWCDDATLDVLDQLLAYPQRHPYLLSILAFRSNEVPATHRIQHARHALKQNCEHLLDFDLTELHKDTVNEMTAYILSTSPEEAQGITHAVYPTCDGNPLLINESLRWLHKHGGIFYDAHGNGMKAHWAHYNCPKGTLLYSAIN
ncbi:MAG: AAA family ATPase [Pseudomonadales bacterium]|nr:AAA family ATPase [Pseudomonadales bacterium]